MKVTKKIVSVTLALIIAVLAFVVPASAAKEIPLIIVDGIFSTELYANYGEENEAPVFPTDEDSITAMATDIAGAFSKALTMYGVGDKNFDMFADSFYPTVNKYIAPMGYNLDGTPMDATIGFDQKTIPMSEYSDTEKEALAPFAEAYADEYGEENVYNFSYDWREDPITVADKLNTYIEEVQGNTGAKKVNLIGYSLGANVVLSYLYTYGGSYIKNLVFIAPAWKGTSLVGNVVANNVEIDIFAVENYLVQSANTSFTTHLIAFVISYIASEEGLSHEYFGDINLALQGILPRMYTDTIIPYIAGMPGFWSLVPDDYYEIGKEFIFGETIDPALEAKIDAYHEIQNNSKAIIESAMAEGMNFGNVVGYNCQMIPISMDYEQSDGIIDVKYASAGANCSKYLQDHDDWDNVYYQKNKDGHNHLSWDSKVDASTCDFPDYTWFIKNLQHSNYDDKNATLDIVMWLLGSGKQKTVVSDKENYPQFWLYNTYKRKAKAIIADEMKGDLNGSGDTETLDARIALKIASGQMKATESQLALGDTDGDGEITLADVKGILSIATGIA